MATLFRSLRRLPRNPRVAVPVLMVVAVLGLFIAQRAWVMFAHADRLADLTRGELCRSFWVGLRFDFFTAATLSVPPVLLLSVAPRGWLSSAGFRWLTAGLCATLLAAATFGAVADFYFFREFDERLNHKALLYLDQPYTYQVIWHNYPVVWAALATLAALAGAAWAIARVTFRSSVDDFALKGRVVWGLLQAALLVLAIRGSAGPKGLNPGPAYFSNSPTLAQVTLNPLFTLKEAALSMTYRAQDLADHLPLLPEDEALDLAARLVTRPQDVSAHDARNPLRRVTDTGLPRRDKNVVLVILESLSWQYLGPLGGDASLTPNLNRLIDGGVIMERCFGVGDRTTRGFAGIVCGYPDLPGRSVTTRIEASGNFLTIGHLLRDRGYETAFVYAGQPMYDYRQSFLKSNGFTRLVFEKEFATKTFRTDLGWCDDDLFGEAVRQCDAMSAAGRPFLATMLTLSFHRPFLIPPGSLPAVTERGKAAQRAARKFADQRAAIRYTDQAIGRFMDKARAAPWFDDTLFVFVADHTGGYAEHPLDLASNRVPLLLYGPKIVGAPRRVSQVCSQTDVIPTIMGVLGGRYEHCFFGSDILARPADAGQALMQRSSGELSYIDADANVVMIPFGGEPQLYTHALPGKLTGVAADAPGAEARRAELARRAIALLQTANTLFERGAYHTGETERADPTTR